MSQVVSLLAGGDEDSTDDDMLDLDEMLNTQTIIENNIVKSLEKQLEESYKENQQLFKKIKKKKIELYLLFKNNDIIKQLTDISPTVNFCFFFFFFFFLSFFDCFDLVVVHLYCRQFNKNYQAMLKIKKKYCKKSMIERKQ